MKRNLWISYISGCVGADYVKYITFWINQYCRQKIKGNNLI